MARLNESLTALKIAQRSMMRNKLQSFLIIAIIAVPVLLVSVLLTVDASTKSTSAEIIKYELGMSSAKYEVQLSPNKNLAQNPNELQLQSPHETGSRNELVDIHTVLPKVELLAIAKTEATFHTAAGIGPVSVTLGESWNKAFLNHGPVSLLEGAVPNAANEVLLSPTAMKRFGVHLGDSISTVEDLKFKVVGILRDYATSTSDDIVFAAADALPNSNVSRVYYYQLKGQSPSWKEVLLLNKKGVAVLSRDVLLNPPPRDELVIDSGSNSAYLFSVVSIMLFLVPLGLLPVVVLAGSAFAFGARRQTRTLAVMSSLGAGRKTLQNVTVTSGVWLGLLGGISGVSLGALLVGFFGPALVTKSFTIQPAWTQYPGFHIPGLLLIILVFASAALGAISSYLPARKASRVNILATLRGQRTESQVRARAAVSALVLLLVGFAVVVLSSMLFTYAVNLPAVAMSEYEQKMQLKQVAVYGQLLGGIITVIGFMVGRGWILRGIRAVIGRLGKQFNFAGRDLLFNRSRYAPVLSSVLVVYFVGALVLSVSYGPMQRQAIQNASQQNFLPGQYNYTFPVSSGEENPTPESYFASRPSAERAEYSRSLITQTKAFTNVVVINATPDFMYGVGSYDAQGNFEESFNFTMPHVIFNPNEVCGYQSFSSHHEGYLRKTNGLNGQNFMNYPAGCINVVELNRTVVVGDVEALRTITNRVDGKAEQVLTEGGVVVLNRLYDFNGTAKIRWTRETEYSMTNNFDTSKASKSVDLPSYLVPGLVSSSLRYSAIVSPETAVKLGITAYPVAVLANSTTPISVEVSDSLMGKGIWFERFAMEDPNSLAWFIALAAGLFVLLSTAIALGLSQIEAAADKRTLASIGAPKSFRARMVATQAFALTFTGALLGGGAGIAVGLTLASRATMSDVLLPWPQVLILLLGVPALAAFGFWVFTPRNLKYEVRQSLD